jgi:plasmid stabilization system protein ParE
VTSFSIAPEAARDIEEIVEYIAQDSVVAALNVQGQLLDTFLHLATFPHSGHVRRDLAGDRKVLFFSAEKYLILYSLRPKGIGIVAVLHSARDIPVALRSRKPTP